MKRFLIRTLLMCAPLVAALAFGACSDTDDPQNVLYVPQDKLKLTFAADDSEAQIVTVTTDADEFKATPDQNWCHVTPQTGKLSVTVDAWTDTENDRTAKITLTAGTAKPVEITVVQTKAEPAAELTLADLNGNYTGTVSMVQIDGTTETPVGDAEAVEFTVTDGKIAIAEFPVHNLLVSIVGEEGAGSIEAILGKVSYECTIDNPSSADTETFKAPLSTQPLSLNVGGMLSVNVGIDSPQDSEYARTNSQYDFWLQTTEITVSDQTFPAGPFRFHFSGTKAE